jgi:hypothetical protein
MQPDEMSAETLQRFAKRRRRIIIELRQMAKEAARLERWAARQSQEPAPLELPDEMKEILGDDKPA